MNQTAPASSKSSRSAPGVIAKVLSGLSLVVLIFILALIFLWAWFIGQSIFQTMDLALKNTQQLWQQQQLFLSLSLYPNLASMWQHWQSVGAAFLQQVSLAFPTLYALSAMLILLSNIVIARGIILFSFLPLFFFLLLLAITDGLVQRDIRKFQGARESTFLFHRSKRLFKLLIFIPLLIYAAWPWVISPLWLLFPQAVGLAGVTQWSVRHFKKYV